jgi:hypothetical protein
MKKKKNSNIATIGKKTHKANKTKTCNPTTKEKNNK